MQGKPSAAAASIVEWMVGAALHSKPSEETFAQLVEALRNHGIPIDRAFFAHPTLHPLYHGAAFEWTPATGLTRETYGGDVDAPHDILARSPVRHVIVNEVTRFRRRLSGPGAMLDFPLLEDFAAEGLTDYLLLAVRFDGFRTTADDDLKGRSGMVCSFATKRPEGFTDEEIETLDWLRKPLAIVVKIADQRQVALSLAECYIGKEAGPLVLGGAIRRGDFATTRAVVWLSDLRSSTELAMSLPREEFVSTINEFFDCTAGAVEEEEGEPLSFIGDAALAIFPIERLGEAGARAAALRAASRAAEASEEMNNRRRARGKAPLAWGLALHAGELGYGNLGSPTRHSWSVIGPVVNETARLEGITKLIGEPVVASRAFVEGLESAADWRAMGAFPLEGVPRAFEVFAPPARICAREDAA
ncbi:adenylate/guanylate cyclase domain-containing protein [Pikeienuella piscinae]|uniref:Adenylate/guanylate cyclase domain-containing protein n=1 Tax=Pikeienuella piscinae TaxID=2748098 RepID=A0A7M3T6H3_9RHOB|nr:adenylate/guanylate cyclase domain-containing protein [Pikeienuella piscinae]QIE57604.1 adenylate/guanylate cyclase domain-containing protein [Pikeienuella piscinae]